MMSNKIEVYFSMQNIIFIDYQFVIKVRYKTCREIMILLETW